MKLYLLTLTDIKPAYNIYGMVDEETASWILKNEKGTKDDDIPVPTEIIEKIKTQEELMEVKGWDDEDYEDLSFSSKSRTLKNDKMIYAPYAIYKNQVLFFDTEKERIEFLRNNSEIEIIGELSGLIYWFSERGNMWNQ